MEPAWLIVANVCRVRPYGEWHEPRLGLRWLRAGAKVYVVGGFGGMGFESVTVVGRHRHGNRFFRQHVQSRFLIDWRVQLVYSPTVLRLATDDEVPPFYFRDLDTPGPDGSAGYRQRLEQLAGSFAADSVRAELTGGPCDGSEVTLGPGEPPTQLLVPLPAQPTDGVRYVRRAWDRTVAYYDHAPSSVDAP
jgi:hypothetical protein